MKNTRGRSQSSRQKSLASTVSTRKVTCVFCGDPVPLQSNGELEPHVDIYPTRWCEGGNRKPGDMSRRPGVP